MTLSIKVPNRNPIRLVKLERDNARLVGFIDESRELLYRRVEYEDSVNFYMSSHCSYSRKYILLLSKLRDIKDIFFNLIYGTNKFTNTLRIEINKLLTDLTTSDLLSYVKQNIKRQEYIELCDVIYKEINSTNINKRFTSYISYILGKDVNPIDFLINTYKKSYILTTFCYHNLSTKEKEVLNISDIKTVPDLIASIEKLIKEEYGEEDICGSSSLLTKYWGKAGNSCLGNECPIVTKNLELKSCLTDIPNFIETLHKKNIRDNRTLIRPIRLPRVMFCINIDNLNNHIYALSDKNEIFVVNLGNVSEKGQICYGNIPETSYDNTDLYKMYETYLSSVFSLSYKNFVLDYKEDLSQGVSDFQDNLSFHSYGKLKEEEVIRINTHREIDLIYIYKSMSTYIVYKDGTRQLIS